MFYQSSLTPKPEEHVFRCGSPFWLAEAPSPYRTVVLSVVDLWVLATSPLGVTVVPLVEVWVLSVMTPSLVVVCCELLRLVVIGSTGGTDCVLVVVDDEDDICAWAAPLIIAKFIIARVNVAAK
jgi:hypothetical protein